MNPKQILYLIIFGALLSLTSMAQTTTVLLSLNTDAIISSGNPTGAYDTYQNILAKDWTNGPEYKIRSILSLNLSSIPSGAVIVSAKLYLHNSNSHANASMGSGTVSNACWLWRITSNGPFTNATWTNQPTATTSHQVELAPSLSVNQDYVADITQLVTDMRNNPSQGSGLEMVLKTEALYCCLSFYSSDYTDATKRPKVEITYITPYALSLPTANNYIYTATPQKAMSTVSSAGTSKNPYDLDEEISYFDGLGRPNQTVSVKASPNGNDIVLPQAYDNFGRENIKYLPYVATTGDGSYKSNAWNSTYTLSDQYTYYHNGNAANVPADASPYAETKYDNSPLNRVSEQGAPGTVWQVSSGHTSKISYDTNRGNEVCIFGVDASNNLLKNGYYTYDPTAKEGQLFVTITKDENWTSASGRLNTTREYKDKLGRVILKKTYNATDSLQTYYVYDDIGLLRYVLTPAAVPSILSAPVSYMAPSNTNITGYCYYYQYDERHRMIVKQLPGADQVYMVYDQRDRLVATQDGNQRAKSISEWTFTKYDAFNRPIMTGVMQQNPNSISSLQSTVNTFTGINLFEITGTALDGYTNRAFPTNDYAGTITISDLLTITYYDNYGPSPQAFDAANNISGYLDNVGNTSYFDNLNNKVTETKTNVLGTATFLTTTNYYDDRYRLIQSRRSLYDRASGGIETISSKYDFTGKVLQTRQSQTFGTSTTYIDKYFTYDHVSRLKKVEQQIIGDAINGLVTVSQESYNEIGELISKKLHGGIQSLDYWYNIRGWLTNINQSYSLNSSGYGDASHDLFAMSLYYNTDFNGNNTSMFNGNISSVRWSNNTNPYYMNYNYTYDNLNRLTSSDFSQYGGTGSTAYEENGITYDLNGNIKTLNRTNNVGTPTNYNYTYVAVTNKLQSITTGQANYTYDHNGNTTIDGLRNFAVTYNLLNLPSTVSKSTDNIAYIYSALGEKLAKKMKDNTYLYYAGNLVYKNDKTINFLLFDEGRISKGTGGYQYEYNIKDHLGNTRIVFAPNGTSTTLLQVADYYPFGSYFSPRTPDNGNDYLYNGKEIQEDILSTTAFNLYDYGARFYDPMIGRWMTIDPLAEKSRRWNPYNYCYDNPMRFIDPDGMVIVDLSLGSADQVKARKDYDKAYEDISEPNIPGPKVKVETPPITLKTDAIATVQPIPTLGLKKIKVVEGENSTVSGEGRFNLTTNGDNGSDANKNPKDKDGKSTSLNIDNMFKNGAEAVGRLLELILPEGKETNNQNSSSSSSVPSVPIPKYNKTLYDINPKNGDTIKTTYRDTNLYYPGGGYSDSVIFNHKYD